MKIANLELSGFKNIEQKTSYQFSDRSNFYLFDSDPGSRVFFFESIMGIIFGFDSDEKVRFRGSPELNKTFTGMLTLEHDQRIIMIERDFETDFVACLLSDPKTTRSIFQGKDFVDNGFSRPYLQMLRSVFPIIDKELFKEVCHDVVTNPKKTFADLIDTLYLLLTPQFKFSAVKYLINDGSRYLKLCEEHEQSEDNLDMLLCQKQALEHLIKIKRTEENLNSDLIRLDILLAQLKQKYNLSGQPDKEIDEKFPALKQFNPLQLRADVLMWQKLSETKAQSEEKLHNLSMRKEHINNILKHDLYEYTLLPDSFPKDVRRFLELTHQLEVLNKTLVDHESLVHKIEESMDQGKKIRLAALVLAPPLVFFLSYILLGPFWMFIIPETILSFFIILFFTGQAGDKNRDRIYHLREEMHILEKRIHDAREEHAFLSKKYRFFEDPSYLDSHLARLQKCRKYQRELKSIEREEVQINTQLASEPYTNQLEMFRQKYGRVIDIERRDLERYLDEYVHVSHQTEKSQNNLDENPVIHEITTLGMMLKKAVKELQQARATILSGIKLNIPASDLDSLLSKLDQKIKNIHMQQTLNSFSSLL